MSDSLREHVPFESEPLTPAQIDARHARHLLDRALTQLERGERNAAAVSCKQAIHLAPNSSHAHSLAGLLALLNDDLNGAIDAYEKSVENFSEGSAERVRLVNLRMSQTNRTPLNVSNLVPNLSGEILRLRAAIQAAPLAEFLNPNGGKIEAPVATSTLDGAPSTERADSSAAAPPLDFFPSPVAAPEGDNVAPPPARSEKRRRLSLAAFAAVAVFTALMSFFAVRAWRHASVEEIPVAPAVAVEPTPLASDGAQAPVSANPAQPVPTPDAPADDDTDEPAAPPPVAPRANPVRSAPRVTTPRVTPPRSNTPVGTDREPDTPRLPPPAAPSTPRATPAPAATPAPRATPEDPNYPPMPPPRITLPSAGRPGPEYPRVLPPSDTR